MTITFEITDKQEAKANKILEERQKNDPSLDIHSLFKLESCHNIGLNDVQLLEDERSEIVAKYDFFTLKQKETIQALVEEVKAAEIAKLEVIDIVKEKNVK